MAFADGLLPVDIPPLRSSSVERSDEVGMMNVRLEPYEVEYAARVGVARMAESLASGRKPRYAYAPAEGWGVHVEGAGAEMAFCKYAGLYWPGHVNHFGGADCMTKDGVGVDVKWTKVMPGRLKMATDSPRDRLYVLVGGAAPVYTLVGWAWGHEIEKSGDLDDPGGRGAKAFFLQASGLRRFVPRV